MIGKAWLELASQLEDELRATNPEACVQAAVDASGMLRLVVSPKPSRGGPARAVIRRYEARGAQVCEDCGGRLASVAAGPVVVFLCQDCRTPAPKSAES